jgi:FSR family fosmidomycin resistance protein-like MFS transporter
MMSIIFLVIEFLDELVFGVTDAAWPLIRSDLGLTYAEIGLALSLPGLLSNFIEPFLFILGDIWRRRTLILLGGILFIVSLILTAASQSFGLLLLSFILFNPSSGMFVSLSQANLMDSEPNRHELNMARWTFAGSLGVFLGPLLLGGMVLLTLGWRFAFVFLALFAGIVLVFVWKFLPQKGVETVPFPAPSAFWEGIKNAFGALKRKEVLRWLVLLEFSDLMLDVLYGFLALYFVDVAGFSFPQAALAVAVWTGCGLASDFLLIPLLERVRGLDYLRVSVISELILFPLFLLSTSFYPKLILVGLLGFFNAGWYAILKANLYKSMPGQSGSVLALDNVSGMFGKLLPLAIGLVAQAYGLKSAMWLLLAGPVVLLIGLPSRNQVVTENK